jgi:uncharacterized protein YjiS (DUF1127 family)
MFAKIERSMNAAFSTGSGGPWHDDAPHRYEIFMESSMSSSFLIRSLAPSEARTAAFDSVGRFLIGTFSPLIRRMREQRILRDLMDLDDHLLNDIGLARRDVQFGNMAELNRVRWSAKGHPDGF